MAATKKHELTSGAISDIINGKTVTNGNFQILNYKRIDAQGGQKYRVILSDGVHSHSSAIFNSVHNERVTSGEVSTNCIIQITRYSTTNQSGKTIIIVNDFDLVAKGEEVENIIGSPISYKLAESENQNPQKKSDAQSTSDPSDAKPTTPKKSKPDFHSIASHNKNVESPSKKVHPISSITPYQNRWTLRARVSNKTPVKTYSNSRGSGQLFNAVLIDETGEIRVTFYNDECERYNNEIQQGQVYQVSQCSIRPANRQYSSVNNDYEMVAQPDSQFFLCEDDSAIPKMDFNFTKIANFSGVMSGTLADIIGVVLSAGETSTITTKAGKELTKREIELGDESGFKIILTLWQNEATNFNPAGANVIACKNVRVGDYGGRTVSTTFDSQLLINPDMTEAFTLGGWYDRVKKENFEFKDFKSTGTMGEGRPSAKYMNLAELKKSISIDSDGAQYASAIVYISQLRYRENALYKACLECKKKLQENDDKELYCDKCNKVQGDFKWNLIMSVELTDLTDSAWATSFQESSEMITGKTAKEIGELREQSEDGNDIEDLLKANIFTAYNLGLKIQMEVYNDEARPKIQITSCQPVKPLAYARKLIQEITTMKI